jgi:transcription elongation factor GreA
MVVRPATLKALKEARAMGDLSENFEYYAAKRDNNINNSRIRYLEKILRFATVIEEETDETRVGMNNTVDVWFEEDDIVETYRIVTSIRSDSRKGLISNESPLGAALMGHRVGDRIEVKMENGGSYFVEIRDLKKTGESEDDRIKQY